MLSLQQCRQLLNHSRMLTQRTAQVSKPLLLLRTELPTPLLLLLLLLLLLRLGV
jgi:hypothetical protein